MSQPSLSGPDQRVMPLGGPRLTEYPAGATLRHSENLLHLLNRPPPPGRAQKFPLAASFKIALSRA